MTVSVTDSHYVDDGVYRTGFDPTTENPCAAVVEAIEAATGSSMQSVLADSIEPDTLVQLYRDDSRDSWMLSFAHEETEITLWGSGRIHVDCRTNEPAESGSQTTHPNTLS
jgi:hypothetical protein